MNMVAWRKYSISISLLVAAGIFGTGIAASPNENSDQLRAELNNVLMNFEEKHSLDGKQMQQIVGDLVLNGRALSPGGVGPIDRGTFVLLDDERNGLIVNRTKWEGEPFEKVQVVITDGKKVLAAPTLSQATDLRIVIFSPSEARIIDPSTNTGASYPRNR